MRTLAETVKASSLKDTIKKIIIESNPVKVYANRYTFRQYADQE